MTQTPLMDDADPTRLVAERLHRLRKANGISLRKLAEATGTSASFLSQLERGLTGASTSTLIRIANCFGTSISELFSGVETGQNPVLRRAQRPSLPVMNGQRKFEVGGSSGDELYTHGDSHEMILVMQGRVRLDLGADSHDLEEGDSVEYATSVPHRVVNIGDGPAEVLFMISPPTSTAKYLDDFRQKGD